MGTSKELQVGQSVFASGNPCGLDQPLTGVINALGFAIPLGTIARIVPELIRTWKNKQGRVGSELAGEQIIKESRERSFHLDGMRRPSGGKGRNPAAAVGELRTRQSRRCDACDSRQEGDSPSALLLMEDHQVGAIVTLDLLGAPKTVRKKLPGTVDSAPQFAEQLCVHLLTGRSPDAIWFSSRS